MRASITATFGDVAEVDELFGQLSTWRPDRLVLGATDWGTGPAPDFWRGQVVGSVTKWSSYPFGAVGAEPLAELRDARQVAVQLAVADRAYQRCQELGIEFVFMLVLPKLPYNDIATARASLPHLFGSDGRFDLTSPAYVAIMERTLEEIRARYPRLTGIEIWVAEGAGATVHDYRVEDLTASARWLVPWLERVDAFGTAHGLEMTVFAHHYVHTRETRRITHALLRDHPSLHVLEDLTWPEEHVALPYLAYLGDGGAPRVARDNPLHLNFLLDSEYMGQGRIPSVLPAWIAGGLRRAEEAGAAWVNGRVNWWDGRATLRGWNLINAELFCALARDPGQDPDRVLEDAVARRFGSRAAGLTGVLLESEAAIRASQTINGVPFSDHSAFPRWRQLNRAYFPGPLSMKAVDDLFLPPGSRLYGREDRSIDAGSEWREQLRLVTQPAGTYFAGLESGRAMIGRLSRGAAAIAGRLQPPDERFVSRSYALWQMQAEAHRLFAEAAAEHAEWTAGRAGAGALGRIGRAMQNVARDVEAAHGDTALFELAPRLRSMASFLGDPTPAPAKGSARLP